MIDDNLQIDLQVEKVKQPQQYLELKNLSRSKQLSYTSRLFTILKDASNSPNASKWKEVQQLRLDYNLNPKNTDSLRRGILLNELVEADCLLDPVIYIQNYNEKNTNHTDPKIGESVESPTGTFRKEFKFDNKLGDYIQSSEAIIPMSLDEAICPEDMLRLHGYDPKKFNLLKCRTSVWQQGNKDKGTKTLYSTKIEVIPKVKEEEKVDYKELFEEIINENKVVLTEKAEQNLGKEYHNYRYDSNCLVIYTPDMHLGRYSSIEDTGNIWNLDIALDQAERTINTIIQKAYRKDIEQIVYVINSDGLNSEYTKYTTSGRNLQDNSNSPTEIYKKVSKFYIWAIEQFAKLAPTKVVNLLGNHSQGYEHTMGLLLEAYFHNDIRVCFDVTAQPRKSVIYGDNLICFAHGDKEGNRLKDIIPNEFNYLWGKTKNHFLLTAHVHHMLWEECANGLEIITFNSPTLNDKYTNDKGYKSKNRSMALLFSKIGLEENYFVNN